MLDADPNTLLPMADEPEHGEQQRPDHELNELAALAAKGASDAQTEDTNLQQVIDAWPDLPGAVRTGIVAMVQAAKSAAPTD